MSNKKGIAWQVMLEFTIGAILLGLILFFFFPELIPYPSKLWDLKEDVLDNKKFQPYEDQLTKDEIKVDDSVNSLQCAINSIAIGKPGFFDETICDNKDGRLSRISSNNKNKLTSNTIFFGGPAMSSMTKTIKSQNKAKSNSYEEEIGCQARYGETCMGCKGSSSKTIVLGVEEKQIVENKGIIELKITDAIHDCYKTYKENPNLMTKDSKYYNCYTLDTRQLNFDIVNEEGIKSKIEIKKEDIAYILENAYLNGKNKYEYGKEITGKGLFNLGELDFETIKWSKKAYCIYYDLSFFKGVTVGKCPLDIEDSMVCEVKDFNLPQDISDVQSIVLNKKPRFLVYYGSFPKEKTAYWKKNFYEKFFSWGTLGNMAFGAVFNWGFGRIGINKAMKEAANDAAKKLAVKEAKTKGIPVVGLCDTNADPTNIDYPIPVNDDAISSLKLILGTIVKILK